MNQTAPKFIGKRISLQRTKNELVITINQQIERWQEAMLMAWLAAWTFCGVIFWTYLLTTENNSERLFFIIITSLWTYFFVRILKVFLWRIGGKEIIKMRKGEVTIQNTYWNRGKINTYFTRNIFKLGLIKKNPNSFFNFMEDSFWIIGADKIGFSYSGTKIQFAKQLNPRDAENLVRTMEFALKEFSKVPLRETEA